MVGVSSRSSWPAGTSSERKATTMRTWHAPADDCSFHRASIFAVTASAHWQSSSSTTAGRAGVPSASRSAGKACTLRVSP